MSDQPSQADIVELANEYRALQRRLEARKQQLQALLDVNAEAGDFPVDNFGVRNRRYSIDFSFVPDSNLEDGVYATSGQLTQESSVVVDSGTIFRCAYLESFVRAVGTADDPYSGDPVTVQATLPWNDRLQYFDFFWKIRDSGSDRDWCDRPQPSLFLGGGYWGPLWLPRRTILSGGTVVTAQVDPFVIVNIAGTGTFFAGGGVSQYLLQISLVGHEVPDLSAL